MDGICFEPGEQRCRCLSEWVHAPHCKVVRAFRVRRWIPSTRIAGLWSRAISTPRGRILRACPAVVISSFEDRKNLAWRGLGCQVPIMPIRRDPITWTLTAVILRPTEDRLEVCFAVYWHDVFIYKRIIARHLDYKKNCIIFVLLALLQTIKYPLLLTVTGSGITQWKEHTLRGKSCNSTLLCIHLNDGVQNNVYTWITFPLWVAYTVASQIYIYLFITSSTSWTSSVTNVQ